MLKTSKFVAIVLGCVFSVSMAYADLSLAPLHPDPAATPGDLCTTSNPDFAEYRYSEKIPYCERNVDYETKVKIYEQYHIPAAERRNYTVDHFIPLSIGGSNEVANLWPEHKRIKETRMNLEMNVYLAVKNGKMTQQAAVQQIIEAKMNPELQ